MSYELKQFYSSSSFKPVMPKNSRWRHFRVKTAKGVWKKIPVRINTAEELKEWINKLGGLDVYYSNSLWTNPHKIASKKDLLKNPISDNWLIKSDLVFDIDANKPITINSLEIARMITANIISAMGELPQFKLQYVSFTGYKGFRISYEDQGELPANPRERIFFLERQRQLVVATVKEIIKEGIKRGGNYYKISSSLIDEGVTVNPLGVVRVLGTGHSTTKYLSEQISIYDITKPVEELLNKINKLGAFRIPFSGEMTTSGDDKKITPRSRLQQQSADVLEAPSADNLFFIGNKVLGTRNNYVPIIVYDERTEYEDEIMSLQKKYGLGTIYVFSHNKKNYLMSLKIMQLNQLKKILSKTTSMNKNNPKKQSKIPLNAKLINKITATATGTISKAHHQLVEGYSNKGMAGNEKIQLFKQIKEAS